MIKKFAASALLLAFVTSACIPSAQAQYDGKIVEGRGGSGDVIGIWSEVENTLYYFELKKPRLINGVCYFFHGLWLWEYEPQNGVCLTAKGGQVNGG